jgi:hypothetical protein
MDSRFVVDVTARFPHLVTGVNEYSADEVRMQIAYIRAFAAQFGQYIEGVYETCRYYGVDVKETVHASYLLDLIDGDMISPLEAAADRMEQVAPRIGRVRPEDEYVLL